MGGVVLAASLIKTASDYQTSFSKYEAMQKQANEMGALTDRMRAALKKNLLQRSASYGQDRRQLEESYGLKQSSLAGSVDKAVGSSVAQGAGSGAKLGGPGTLTNIQRTQQQSGLQGIANMLSGRQEDLARQKSDYTTGRDTMKSNVDEQIKKVEVERDALRTASTDMMHNAQRGALFNFVTTAASLGAAGGVSWFSTAGTAGTAATSTTAATAGTAGTAGWFSNPSWMKTHG
jgi:hypothetical protein